MRVRKLFSLGESRQREICRVLRLSRWPNFPVLKSRISPSNAWCAPFQELTSSPVSLATEWTNFGVNKCGYFVNNVSRLYRIESLKRLAIPAHLFHRLRNLQLAIYVARYSWPPINWFWKSDSISRYFVLFLFCILASILGIYLTDKVSMRFTNSEVVSRSKDQICGEISFRWTFTVHETCNGGLINGW